MNAEAEKVDDEKTAPHIRDANELSKTALKEKYPLTYTSWRNGKQRAGPERWASEFRDFADFLRVMGPRPSKAHTLDREDNSNPNYGPGLCRWLDKAGQANNRSSTLTVEHGGVERPVSEIAREAGVNPSVLRQRLNDNWITEEAISGRRSENRNKFGRNPHDHKPWPVGREASWELDFLNNGGTERTTRYSFLIYRLHKAKTEESERLEQDWDNGLYGTAEYQERSEFINALQREYLRAISEEVQWLEEVARYDRIAAAKDFEKNTRNRNRLAGRAAYDDEEKF